MTAQQNRFATEQVDAPEAVLGLRDQGQPRRAVAAARLRPVVPDKNSAHDILSQKETRHATGSFKRTRDHLTHPRTPFFAASFSAQAESEPDVGGSNRPLWEAGFASSGLNGLAYPGAIDRVSRGLVLPWIVYRGPVLGADGGAVGARVAKTPDLELDLGFAGALSARSSDATIREGMPDLGLLLEFGPRVRYTLDHPSSDSLVRLDVPLRGVFELKNGLTRRGLAFEPRFSFDKRDSGSGWGFSASASLNFGDQKFNEHRYGVPTRFATPARSAYLIAEGGPLGVSFQAQVSNHSKLLR